MITESDLLEALAAEFRGQSWQPGDITIPEMIEKTGGKRYAVRMFLDTHPGLQKIPLVYVPHLNKRMNVYRPKDTAALIIATK